MITLGGGGDGPDADAERRVVSLALSPSRAGDFMRCPLLFRLRAIDRRPERPGSAAVRGSLVHAVLDALFDLPAPQRTQSAAIELLRPCWESMLASDPAVVCALDDALPFPLPPGATAPEQAVVDGWLAGAHSIIATYFKLEDPRRLEPAARELALSAQLPDGPPVKGIVDRLDVSPSGLMRVVDYKTGRSPGPAFEQQAMFQLRFYAVMIWRSRGEVPTRLQLLYLGDGQSITYDPSPEELVAFEAKVGALWKAIIAALESGDWRPRPSRMCRWCDHHDACPEQGGSTPELPIVEVRFPQ